MYFGPSERRANSLAAPALYTVHVDSLPRHREAVRESFRKESPGTTHKDDFGYVFPLLRCTVYTLQYGRRQYKCNISGIPAEKVKGTLAEPNIPTVSRTSPTLSKLV